MIKNKIKTREELAKISEELRKQGLVIGFTSGSFDIMHSGHADYLEKAKEKCDVLIVGINSDESVKKYKGEDRPIISEMQRIKLITALGSVDYAFLFNERRNKDNIITLKPHLYIKAGDYKENELTSAEYLKEWDGKVELIPIEDKISSSMIIDKIKRLDRDVKIMNKDEETASYIEIKSKKISPVIFLDRDGVINEEIHYLHEPEKFKIIHGVIEGLKKMQDMGYKLIIITNQAGIGLGYYTKEDFFRVNSRMLKELSKNGIMIHKIYFCPHSEADNCNCRKPRTGMFEKAKQDLKIIMERSFTIGDRTIDILAGKNTGTKTILVKTGYGGNDGKYEVEADFTAKDLVEAAEWIKKIEGK